MLSKKTTLKRTEHPIKTAEAAASLIVFENQKQRLGEIIKDHSLPLVIQCCDPPGPEIPHAKVHLHTPILAYSIYPVTEVKACNVVFQHDTRKFVIARDDLMIPENFSGWFAIMGKPGHLTTPGIEPHYKRLSDLAHSTCTSFLVAGQEPIKAFSPQNTGKKSSEVKWKEYTILPGAVLHKGPLIQKDAQNSKKKKLNRNSKEFLMCTDERNRDLKIDLLTEGKFYVISQNETPDIPPVMRMNDILQRYELPLYVKLVSSHVPYIHFLYSSTMLLMARRKTESVIVSTLMNYENVMLELFLNSPRKYQVAKNTPELLHCDTYTKAVERCRCIPLCVTWMKISMSTQNNDTDNQSKSDKKAVNTSNDESQKPEPHLGKPDSDSNGTPTGDNDYAAIWWQVDSPSKYPQVYSNTPSGRQTTVLDTRMSSLQHTLQQIQNDYASTCITKTTQSSEGNISSHNIYSSVAVDCINSKCQQPPEGNIYQEPGSIFVHQDGLMPNDSLGTLLYTDDKLTNKSTPYSSAGVYLGIPLFSDDQPTSRPTPCSPAVNADYIQPDPEILKTFTETSPETWENSQLEKPLKETSEKYEVCTLQTPELDLYKSDSVNVSLEAGLSDNTVVQKDVSTNVEMTTESAVLEPDLQYSTTKSDSSPATSPNSVCLTAGNVQESEDSNSIADTILIHVSSALLPSSQHPPDPSYCVWDSDTAPPIPPKLSKSEPFSSPRPTPKPRRSLQPTLETP